MIMNEVDFNVFDTLFREACQKCYGHPMKEPLTETESRLMYARIFEETGLVVGWKSIKNYSLFVLAPKVAKPENPSVATLDTLSRFVVGAPYTTEPDRKKEAGHYPYWYDYKAQWMGRRVGGTRVEREVVAEEPAEMVVAAEPEPGRAPVRRWFWWRVVLGLVLAIVAIILVMVTGGSGKGFSDQFANVSADTLHSRGWWVKAPDSAYWNRRGETPGCLTLFTLKGDNWPDSADRPQIRNLLMHRIGCDCWTAEVRLSNFVPRQNWQQAGILLMEDTGFSGKSMRVSIAYNDFNGVYPRSGTIILQGVASRGRREDKPEEFMHSVILQTDSLKNHPALYRTLAYSAFRIEKRGDRYRILYADGIGEHTGFKEIISQEFSFEPRYLGLFALRGHVDSAAAVPARFTYFGLDCCPRR